MRICCDTNVFMADRAMEGGAFQLLFSARSRLRIDLVMPELVLEELVESFRRETSELFDDFKKLQKKAERLSLRRDMFVVPDLDINALAEKYHHFVDTRFKAIFAPLPDTGHLNLVRRATQRRRPFDQAGGGYRDALLWETMTEMMSSNAKEDFVFVTANTKDFFLGDDLHPDLACDLEERKIAPSRLRVFKSLKSFVDQVVTPGLERFDEIRPTLESDTWTKFQIKPWLNKQLGAALFEDNKDEYVSHLVDEGATTMCPAVNRINTVTIDAVRFVPDDTLLISLSVTADLHVPFEIQWEAYEASAELRQLFPHFEGDRQDIYTEWPEHVHVEMAIYVRQDSGELIATEIDGIKSSRGNFVFNDHLTDAS